MQRTLSLFATFITLVVVGCVPEPSPPEPPTTTTTTTSTTTSTTTTTTTTPPEIAITASDPASPAQSLAPRLSGFAPTATTTIRLFPTPDCAGSAPWGGDLAAFSGAGIVVNVTMGSTTQFSALATGPGVTVCSAPFTYVNSLPAPTGYEHEPNGTVAEANAVVVDVGTPADIYGALDGPVGLYASDNFTFDVEAGRSIRIETFDSTGVACSGFTDTKIYLYPPLGGTGGIDDNSGIDFCSLIDPAVDTYTSNVLGGSYRVLVQGTPGGGNYRIRIEVLP